MRPCIAVKRWTNEVLAGLHALHSHRKMVARCRAQRRRADSEIRQNGTYLAVPDMVIGRSRWNHVLATDAAARQRVNHDGHFQIVSDSTPTCHCSTGTACIQFHLAPTLGFNLSSLRQLMAIRLFVHPLPAYIVLLGGHSLRLACVLQIYWSLMD